MLSFYLSVSLFVVPFRCLAIAAHAVHGQVYKMQALFDEALDHVAEGRIPAVTPLTYATCIIAWSKDIKKNSEALLYTDKMARKMLIHLAELGKIARYRIESNGIVSGINSAIAGWRDSGLPDAGRKAEELLSLMEEAHEVCQMRDLQPSSETYGLVIDAWRNSGSSRMGLEALDLLERMESFNLSKAIKAQNDVLVKVMRALCQNTEGTLIDDIDQVFGRICDNYLHGDTTADISSKITTFFLVSFVESAELSAARRSEAFLRTVERLSETEGLDILRVSNIEYNCVLHRYVKDRSYEDADRVLEQMLSGPETIRPDILTYSVLIMSFLESGQKDQVERGLGIVREIISATENGVADDKVQPDEGFFAACLLGLAKMNQNYDGIVDLAFWIYGEMRERDILPTTTIFSVLSQLTRKYGNVDDVVRLMSALNDLEEIGSPSAEKLLSEVTYTNVLSSIMGSQDDSCKAYAAKVLSHMETRAEEGKLSFSMNRGMYHIVLSGWARSGKRESFNKTLEIVEKLEAAEDASLRPLAHTYNWVSRCLWANRWERIEFEMYAFVCVPVLTFFAICSSFCLGLVPGGFSCLFLLCLFLSQHLSYFSTP